MAALHRTPVHAAMLDAVTDERIVWNPALGGGGGGLEFRARRLHLDFHQRHALWEMRHAGLIAVDGTTVVVTAQGGERRLRWQAAGAR